MAAEVLAATRRLWSAPPGPVGTVPGVSSRYWTPTRAGVDVTTTDLLARLAGSADFTGSLEPLAGQLYDRLAAGQSLYVLVNNPTFPASLARRIAAAGPNPRVPLDVFARVLALEHPPAALTRSLWCDAPAVRPSLVRYGHYDLDLAREMIADLGPDLSAPTEAWILARGCVGTAGLTSSDRRAVAATLAPSPQAQLAVAAAGAGPTLYGWAWRLRFSRLRRGLPLVEVDETWILTELLRRSPACTWRLDMRAGATHQLARAGAQLTDDELVGLLELPDPAAPFSRRAAHAWWLRHQAFVTLLLSHLAFERNVGSEIARALDRCRERISGLDRPPVHPRPFRDPLVDDLVALVGDDLELWSVVLALAETWEAGPTNLVATARALVGLPAA